MIQLRIIGDRSISAYRLSPFEKCKSRTTTLFDKVVVLDSEFGVDIIIKYVISV